MFEKLSKKNILILLVLLIALPLAVYLVRQAVRFIPRALPAAVDIFFIPDTANLPPDTAFAISLDAKSNLVGFVRIEADFDNSKINLTNEIQTTDKLKTVIKKTSMTEANSSGHIAVVLGLSPDDKANPPTGVFEFATLTFSRIYGSGQTDITINDAGVQIVDLGANELSFTSGKATINLGSGPTDTPTPTKAPTPTFPPPPTSTPTKSPTPPPPAGNILLNPSFEDGTISWNKHSDGNMSFTTDSPGTDGNYSAKLSVSQPGNNVQLYQYGLKLNPNTSYTLSFDAKSNTEHDLSVYVHEHDDDFTNYGLTNYQVDLTQSWKSFLTEFTTKNFTSVVNDARLRFWFGPYDAAGDVYWIDNVNLAESAPAPTAIFTPTLAATNTPIPTLTFTPTATNTPTNIPTSGPTNTPTSIPGDLDGDGDVDIFDYNLLVQNFGVSECGNIGDIDDDCDVDIFDYNILVQNFGK